MLAEEVAALRRRSGGATDGEGGEGGEGGGGGAAGGGAAGGGGGGGAGGEGGGDGFAAWLDAEEQLVYVPARQRYADLGSDGVVDADRKAASEQQLQLLKNLMARDGKRAGKVRDTLRDTLRDTRDAHGIWSPSNILAFLPVSVPPPGSVPPPWLGAPHMARCPPHGSP